MPESEPRFHNNPQYVPSRVYGRRLVPGDVIEATDLYASTNGRWEPAPLSGVVLGEGIDVIWVRPETAT